MSGGFFPLDNFMHSGYFDPKSDSAPSDANRFMLISYQGDRAVRYQCVYPSPEGYRIEQLNPNQYFLNVSAVVDAFFDLDPDILKAGGAFGSSIAAFAVGSLLSVALIQIAALVMIVVSSIWLKDVCVEMMKQHTIYQVENQRIIVVQTEEGPIERSAQAASLVGTSPQQSLYLRDPTPEQVAAKKFIIRTIAEGPIKAGLNQRNLKRLGALLRGHVHPLRQLVIVFSDRELVKAMRTLLSFCGLVDKKVKEGYLNGTKQQPGMGQELATAAGRKDLECHLQQFCKEISSAVTVEPTHLKKYAKTGHWENFLRVCAGLRPIE